MRQTPIVELIPELDIQAYRREAAVPPIKAHGLTAIQSIETIDHNTAYRIVPIVLRQGSAAPVAEVMAAKVKWASRAGYSVLSRDVPPAFAPHNAIIRISAGGTEDRDRDYLARFNDEVVAQA